MNVQNKKKQPLPSRAKPNQHRYVFLFIIGLAAALAITGFFTYKAVGPRTTGDAVPLIEGIQEVRMAVNGIDYEPAIITITAGQKVRWVIDATDAAGCARSLISPEIGVRQVLKPGENVIEFTPTQRGTIAFTCSMGMTSGEFRVV